MALMAMTTIGPRVPFQRIRAPRVMVLMRAETSVSFNKTVDNVAIGNAWEGPYQRLLFSCGRDYMSLSWPTFATGSGLEASITDQKKNDLSLDNVKIVVESRDDDKIHVRVDLTGEETQKAFDDILTNLARTAPPIPGFRRTKGASRDDMISTCPNLSKSDSRFFPPQCSRDDSRKNNQCTEKLSIAGPWERPCYQIPHRGYCWHNHWRLCREGKTEGKEPV
uniref:Uncharacterized protein LOC105035340 isoform X2 n=1 Tax=Elaeis guineensis var. tenera TaxID=51953 RepID=A0A8N4IBK6_ELAGV|nr:uncharacterized protein LOC105035340 isoform X2 [Elaeis guineensis]